MHLRVDAIPGGVMTGRSNGSDRRILTDIVLLAVVMRKYNQKILLKKKQA